ncbi:hypothetical protein BGX23_012758 [Mortierella sp. AD031]|nr:hypothetical protein BGX23_012758 [Mortierella sp. AD031]
MTITKGRQRGRTHSNTTSVIDPSALQYASKFSASNNNVTITSPMASLSNVSGPTTMTLPQGGLQLHPQHHHSTSANTSSVSSTTSTFYSGVKLAPPVLSASVEHLERRASDQKVWYTIQVCPCDLTIIAPVGAATSAATLSIGTAAGGTGGAMTSIPRKPYTIYRRYEDVADFADQLEEEFVGRMLAPSTVIGLQHDANDSNAASTATSTPGGANSTSYDVNGVVPGSGSIAFTEKGMDGGASAINNGNSIAANNTNHGSSSTSTASAALPRLKLRLVLFVTKSVCLQRKEELGRYLQELFTLGPIIAHSRLVAEFFGIWKTDMEVHLSQEDRDPLALHSVAAMATVLDNEKDSNVSHEHKSEGDNEEDAIRGETTGEGPTLADGPVATTTDMDSFPAAQAASPSPPIPTNHANAQSTRSTYNSSSSMTDSSSFSTSVQLPCTAASMKNTTQAPTYLASPSLSPSPSTHDSRDEGWTPSLSTHLPLTIQTGNDVDAEMVSPIEPSAPVALGPSHLESTMDGYESGAGTETETFSDLTTRTIKKFKSLRRAHTLNQNRQQQQQQQDSSIQEDTNPVPTDQSNSVSGPTGANSTSVGVSPMPLTTIWSFGTNGDQPTVATGSLAGLSWSSMSTSGSNNSGSKGSNVNNTNGNSSGSGARSISISSTTTPATLVAPWNRANTNGETPTHLHSLIKISGQPSPSLQSPMSSPFVPVELGRSFHRKENHTQKSPSTRRTKDRAVPVLTQPPEARNRNFESASLAFAEGSMAGRPRRPGMPHSVSAPGGFLPIMAVSAPESSSSTSASGSMTDVTSSGPVKAAVTKKRVSLHSPSLPTKQPVGILKNAQRGACKASLTVPGAVMFPVQPSPSSGLTFASAFSTSVSSSSSTLTPIGASHGVGTLATTFKIVMDADTIVALQVLEDRSFVLTMPELRSRVKAKLTKSNIQLPDKFDLIWTMPTNSMSLASPSFSSINSSTPSTPMTPASGITVMSINQALDQGVTLRTDEDLHRAIHASRNHKVTLRCVL